MTTPRDGATLLDPSGPTLEPISGALVAVSNRGNRFTDSWQRKVIGYGESMASAGGRHVLRPKDPETARCWQGPPGVPLPRDGCGPCEWAGRADLAAAQMNGLAEHVAGAARQAGAQRLDPERRIRGRFRAVLTGRARALGRIASPADPLTVGAVLRGQLQPGSSTSRPAWLYFVTRDQRSSASRPDRRNWNVAGRGYVAMVFRLGGAVHVRLAPPLVSAAPGPATSVALPLPPNTLDQWRRLLPVVAEGGGSWHGEARALAAFFQARPASKVRRTALVLRRKRAVPRHCCDESLGRARELEDRMRGATGSQVPPGVRRLCSAW